MENRTPLISVVMLARDRETLLEASVRSVLAQTERSFELIILDDGSTDGTLALAQELATQDARIVVLRNEHSIGIPRARNVALGAARGELLAVWDSDDLCKPTRLAQQRSVLEAEPQTVGVGTRFRIFSGDDIDGGVEPGWHYGLRDGRMPFLFGSGMFRTAALREAGGCDERYALAEDLELSYRLLAAGHEFATIDEILMQYRRHDASTTHARAIALAWWNLRAQLAGVRVLRGRFSTRGYLTIIQSVLRLVLALVGLRR